MLGTKRVFAGIKERERADLISYLRERPFFGNSSRRDSAHPRCVPFPGQVMMNVPVW